MTKDWRNKNIKKYKSDNYVWLFCFIRNLSKIVGRIYENVKISSQRAGEYRGMGEKKGKKKEKKFRKVVDKGRIYMVIYRR